MTDQRGSDIVREGRPTQAARAHTILVVGDERKTRDRVAALLADEGYSVVVAANAFEALGIIAEEAVDLLFTDVRMPGMDGYELARRAKQLRPQLPVIYTTGYASRLPGGGEALGGTILNKPQHREELLSEFARALTDRPA